MSFMESRIIENKHSIPAWLSSLGQPVAARLLAWEQAQTDELLADVFGYHAVQLGWQDLQALRTNRMQHRWHAHAEFEGPQVSLDESDKPDGRASDVWLDSRAWPWQADSLDLVVLPHALERSADPHACLREVERVLIPEGQLLITGLNPMSWWGLQQSRSLQCSPVVQEQGQSLIAYRRLRDWLRLLGFEVQVSRFGGWTPAWRNERWMQRMGWMESVGQRWWPIFGGVYLLMATKRVPGGRLLEARQWRKVRSPAVTTVPVARSDTSIGRQAVSKDIVDPR